jgi:Thermophilic metalloprotease (M29)
MKESMRLYVFQHSTARRRASEGARRLGEVALVPSSSPIARSGLVFFNTLLDENAGRHASRRLTQSSSSKQRS